jgi:PKD domain/RTX calcium-binding nonapeptide repeat (4 copies)
MHPHAQNERIRQTLSVQCSSSRCRCTRLVRDRIRILSVLVIVVAASLFAGKASAQVRIQFKMVDTTAEQFFAVQERKDALDAVKTDFEARLGDSLTPITVPWTTELPQDPRTGNPPAQTLPLSTFYPDFNTSPAGLSLEQNTIVVLVGVHPVATGTFSRGASLSTGDKRGTSHFVPSVGILTFSDDPNWCFKLDACPQKDFVATAAHELTHILGFTKSNSSVLPKCRTLEKDPSDASGYKPCTADSAQKAFFIGEESVALYKQWGGRIDLDQPGVPLDLKTPGHWAPWRKDKQQDMYQAFNRGPADPSQSAAGFFETLNGVPLFAGMQELNAPRPTELDYRALKDIGWNVKNLIPGPLRASGSAVGQSYLIGFECFSADECVNKVAAPPGFQPGNMQQATFLGRAYTASTDGSGNISIAVAGNTYPTGKQARGRPALAVNNDQLFMAWTATDGVINVTQITVNAATGAVTGDAQREALPHTSGHGPALAAHLGALILAFSGPENHLLLDLKATVGPKNHWGAIRVEDPPLPAAFDTRELTNDTPNLTVFNIGIDQEILSLFLGWIGSDGNKLGHVAVLGQVQQALQILPVVDHLLIVDGDQFGSNFDDDITIEANNGLVRVTLNGIASEFAPSDISSGIVINTGGGANVVKILASFPGLPITINGAGTDFLTFGPNPPANITYTPDANGLSGYGTLDAGGMPIRFAGLEFVDSVAPRVTGMQLDRTTINENDVATLTGTFADPGAYSTHSVAIGWGDGTSDPIAPLGLGARSFVTSHRYFDDNPTGTPSDQIAITVTLTDNDNLTGTSTTPITVDNVLLVITSVSGSAPSSTPATEGAPVTLSGAFTDVGTRDTHTATVDWGDGKITAAQVTESGGSGTFQAQHAFTSGGIYTVKVTITDDDTGVVNATVTMFVTGVGVQTINGRVTLVAVGTAGDDSLDINQANGEFVVHASFLSSLRTIPVAGIQLIEVVLLAGNDTATIANNIELPSVMDGGAGDDKLIGGGGPNILIGGRGNDTLIGGRGRNMLIGGLGADRLVGNVGDDILIAGSTRYDSGPDLAKLANDAILMQLLAEWNSTRSYEQRIANLRAGAGPILGGAGVSLSKGTTVFDDTAFDRLTGAGGQNWFFFDPTRDQVTDQVRGEVVN